MYYENQFYPTPSELADKMAGKIGEDDKVFLEPSAGNGDLVSAIARKKNDKVEVDCIEINDLHRAVLKQNFSDETEDELRERYHSIKWDNPEYEAVSKQYAIVRDTNMNVVFDDFLEFRTHKKYDCIMMNPPFAEAEAHILKAIEMQKSGGRVIALCNAETLRNPYTNARKALVKAIEENGEVEYLKGAFSDAERKTDVDVALIHVFFESEEKESDIISNLRKAEEAGKAERVSTEVSVGGNYIEKLLEQFDFECKACVKLLREYEAMKPLMLDSVKLGTEHDQYRKPIIEVSIRGSYDSDINALLKAIRKKYWEAMFHSPEFVDRMTSELREEFYGLVGKMAEYDFNEFNISQVLDRMQIKLNEAYKNSVVSVFEKLSCLHYYSGEPEDTNIHYFNGWKTNKAWKVGEKNIVPCYAYTSFAWDTGRFRPHTAVDLLSDIVKVLDYLDNGESVPMGLDLSCLLQLYDSAKSLRNIRLKYFDVSFFKKGTCHIKWTNLKVLEKLNIVGSQLKGWLPPGYGKKKYEDMSSEEKSVVDEFQGKEKYEEILSESGYYLSNMEPLMIGGPNGKSI